MKVKNLLSVLLVPLIKARQLYKKARLQIDLRDFKKQIDAGTITPGKAAGILTARYRSTVTYVEAIKQLKVK